MVDNDHKRLQTKCHVHPLVVVHAPASCGRGLEGDGRSILEVMRRRRRRHAKSSENVLCDFPWHIHTEKCLLTTRLYYTRAFAIVSSPQLPDGRTTYRSIIALCRASRGKNFSWTFVCDVRACSVRYSSTLTTSSRRFFTSTTRCQPPSSISSTFWTTPLSNTESQIPKLRTCGRATG